MRSESNRVFAGVCGGVATYLGVDAIFVRLAFLLLTFASGIGILLYLILMILMPSENSGSDQPSSEVIQNNVERLGDDVSSGVQKMRQHPQGPTIAAGLLILFGIYFLLENVGWLYWFNGNWLWPIAIIGLGAYLLIKRNRA
jgi:phage shock protein PspC (stress-responsive transcriptional regulator)